MAQKYKVYDICCGKCGAYTLTYHKYGAGKGILRLYFHRIVAPDSFVNLHRQTSKTLKDIPPLRCTECAEVLGNAVVSKGNKWAFRMRQGLFHRKLKK